jgi:hypothetical protein
VIHLNLLVKLFSDLLDSHWSFWLAGNGATLIKCEVDPLPMSSHTPAFESADLSVKFPLRLLLEHTQGNEMGQLDCRNDDTTISPPSKISANWCLIAKVILV